MHWEVLAFGQKMPSWLEIGIADYQKRLPRPYQLSFHELPLQKRSKTSDLSNIQKKESATMLSHLKPHSHIIALEVEGKSFDSPKMAKRLAQLEQHCSHIQFMIGGPEGLSTDCQNAANEHWSLSLLTLSHPLVRLFLAESLYRCWAINQNHPYHK